jgi:glycosyltransferase involved in cell wall biosynthesis
MRDVRPTHDNAWVVIPAYNEARSIAGVVDGLRRAGYANVCVVNDGSRDGTGALALRAGAHVVEHITNFGQGAALQTGIDYALANGAQYVCTFDADGQHSVDSLGALLRAIDEANADVALGSRFLAGGSKIPPLRRVLLLAALAFTRLHARLDVSDTHNGLRVFSRRAAQIVRIEQPQMAHASEILQKIGAARLHYVEVPVTIAYTDYSRAKGQSGFDSVKILLDLLYRSIAVRH